MCGAQPSAYAQQPWETVNYADCHDGQTLFDQVLTLLQLQLLLMLMLLVVNACKLLSTVHIDCVKAVMVHTDCMEALMVG